MKMISVVPVAALVFVAEIKTTYAGFFGTFCPGPEPCELPEPSSLALFAVGGIVGLATYLKNRNRDK